MTPDPPNLTDAEREALARNPQDPTLYAAIRDLPRTTGGARSVADVLAAVENAKRKEQK